MKKLRENRRLAEAERGQREEKDGVTCLDGNPDDFDLFGAKPPSDDDAESVGEQTHRPAVFAGYDEWIVAPHGWSSVGGRGNIYYDYVLQHGGVKMGIRKQASDRIPNVKVDFGSIPLAQLGGLAEAWNWFVRSIGDFGGEVRKHILSRVDIYTDVMGEPVAGFQKRFLDGWRICRGRLDREYVFLDDDIREGSYRVGRRDSGVTLGKDTMIRIYDKLLEMRNQPEKQAVFCVRWNRIPDVTTRVEFQLRRDSLRRLAGAGYIDRVEDYMRDRAAIWRYLAEKWFRLTDGPVDFRNNNRGRVATWPVWEKVQTAAGDDAVPARRVRRPVKVDVSALVAQFASCAAKAAVQRDRPVDGLRDLSRASVELLGMYVSDERASELGDRFRREKDMRMLPVPPKAPEETDDAAK